MPKPASSPPLWQLHPEDPAAAANAVVALNLLRCIRALPGQYPGRNHDDVGRVFAPVIDTLPSTLRRRLQPAGSPVQNRRHDPDDWDEAERIGEALCTDLRRTRSLFDAVDQALQGFVQAHPTEASANVMRLAEALSLQASDHAFLNLAAALSLGTLERECFSFVSTPTRVRRVMARVFGASAQAAAEGPAPMLRQAGLLNCVNPMRPNVDLEDLLRLTGAGERLLCAPHASMEDMTATVLQPLPAPPTGPALAWPHLADQQAVALAALRGALASGSPGFNLLVHGEPGTGKTAFVQQLVGALGAQGYRVDHADENGLEASRLDRLASLSLCQTFTRGRRHVLLVLDEAEDVFPAIAVQRTRRAPGRQAPSKAWVNHLLEHNQQPVIWISNRVDHLDPAHLRRFSLCVGFPRTPYALRRDMAEHRLAALQVSEQAIEHAATSEVMSPALLDNAARLLGLVRGASGDECPPPDAVVQAVIAGHAAAAGLPAQRTVARPVLRFDPRHLNLRDGLTPGDVLDAARDATGAALLFHGVPGTGKTQFAAELARSLGRRLTVRTASDINSQWYGQSEANVARMFSECDPNTEVLLLDEADVLLGARSAAQHRADRAVTAEFLRWLECFEGVFICATNHPESIDPALRRRFVLKVGFQPLTPTQRAALLQDLLAETMGERAPAGPVLPDADAMRELQALDGLTAGDFANVARRLKRRKAEPADWLRELAIEQRAKHPVRGPRIGFV